MTETAAKAQVVRALTTDHYIRLATLDARPLWDAVRRGHPGLEADACATLTELLAATLLLQSRSLFVERLQVMIRSSGQARAIVADAWPDGTLRGLLDLGPDQPAAPWLEEPGVFQVMRSGTRGEPYVGKLPLVPGGISTQFEAYLQHSEQIQASLTVWCDPGTGESGGLMVEPLPACPPERMQRLVDAVEGLEVVPIWERDPDFLLRWINQGNGAERLSTHDIEYRCRCSHEALLSVLRSFPADRLEELFAEGRPAEVRCDYCGRAYAIHREDVVGHG